MFEPELPGTEFYWVDGGPRTRGAIRGFVRVQQEAELPPHEHLGDEQVLVLQGVYIDGPSGRRLLPGDVHESVGGSTHDFAVGQGGADLLMLVVVFGGYKIGGLQIGPRS